MTTKSPPLPHKKIGVGVIYNDRGEILIDRRRNYGLIGGLWEFPGGKIKVRETVRACIKREIKEELALDVEVGDHLITINHTYSQFSITLIVHYCSYLGGEPQPLECEEIRWVTLEQMDNFAFPEANSQIIAALRQDKNFTDAKNREN